jgi:hypothetical protein
MLAVGAAKSHQPRLPECVGPPAKPTPHQRPSVATATERSKAALRREHVVGLHQRSAWAAFPRGVCVLVAGGI